MRTGIAIAALLLAFQIQADPPTLFVGKYHTKMASLKKASVLAAANPDCKHVLTGAYIPPAEQQQPGQDYMITCDAPGKPGGFMNLYLSEAQVKAGQAALTAHPLPRAKALHACERALASRFGTSHGISYIPAAISDNGSLNRRVDFIIHTPAGPMRAYCIVEPTGHAETRLLLN